MKIHRAPFHIYCTPRDEFYAMRHASRHPAHFTLGFLVLSLLACSLGSLDSQTRGQYGFTAEERRAQEDKKLAQKLETAR